MLRAAALLTLGRRSRVYLDPSAALEDPLSGAADRTYSVPPPDPFCEPRACIQHRQVKRHSELFRSCPPRPARPAVRCRRSSRYREAETETREELLDPDNSDPTAQH